VNSDRNSAMIVSALRQAGAFVAYIDPDGSDFSAGLPDLLVATLVGGVRRTALLEVKGVRGRLNDKQVSWHMRWDAAGGCPVYVVRDVESALAAVGLGG